MEVKLNVTKRTAMILAWPLTMWAYLAKKIFTYDYSRMSRSTQEALVVTGFVVGIIGVVVTLCVAIVEHSWYAIIPGVLSWALIVMALALLED